MQASIRCDIELFNMSFFNENHNKLEHHIIILDNEHEVIIGPHILHKPFKSTQLLQILCNALITHNARKIQIGHYIFCPSQQYASCEEDLITFTSKEAELLAYLIQSNRPIHRDQLLKQIWGYDTIIETQTLETHIQKLKNKMPILKKMITRNNAEYIFKA